MAPSRTMLRDVPHAYLEATYPERRRRFHDITFMEGKTVGGIGAMCRRLGRLIDVDDIRFERNEDEESPLFGRVTELRFGRPLIDRWHLANDIAICDQIKMLSLYNCTHLPQTMHFMNSNLTRLVLLFDSVGNDCSTIRPSGPMAALCNLQDLQIVFRCRVISGENRRRVRRVAEWWVDDLCRKKTDLHPGIDDDGALPDLSFRKSLKKLKLRALHLSTNDFNRIMWEALPQFPNLEELDLSDNAITSLQGVEHLAGIKTTLPRLRALDLYRTMINSSSLEEKRFVVLLLQVFPELGSLFGLANNPSIMQASSSSCKEDRLIFHWLTINRAGRVLVPPPSEVMSSQQASTPMQGLSTRQEHPRSSLPIPLSVWPTVLARCNTIQFESTVHTLDFKKTKKELLSPGQFNAMFYLLKHGQALSRVSTMHATTTTTTTTRSHRQTDNTENDSTVSSSAGSIDGELDVSLIASTNDAVDRKQGGFLSKMKRKERAYV